MAHHPSRLRVPRTDVASSQASWQSWSGTRAAIFRFPDKSWRQSDVHQTGSILPRSLQLFRRRWRSDSELMELPAGLALSKPSVGVSSTFSRRRITDSDFEPSRSRVPLSSPRALRFTVHDFHNHVSRSTATPWVLRMSKRAPALDLPRSKPEGPLSWSRHAWHAHADTMPDHSTAESAVARGLAYFTRQMARGRLQASASKQTADARPCPKHLHTRSGPQQEHWSRSPAFLTTKTVNSQPLQASSKFRQLGDAGYSLSRVKRYIAPLRVLGRFRG